MTNYHLTKIQIENTGWLCPKCNIGISPNWNYCLLCAENQNARKYVATVSTCDDNVDIKITENT